MTRRPLTTHALLDRKPDLAWMLEHQVGGMSHKPRRCRAFQGLAANSLMEDALSRTTRIMHRSSDSWG